MQEFFKIFVKKFFKIVEKSRSYEYLCFMKDFETNSFWNRIDGLLKVQHKTLTDLCADCEIPYSSVNNQRMRNNLPKAEQFYVMAQYLGTSMEFLLTGIEPKFEFQEPLKSVVELLRTNEEVLDAVCTLCHIKRGDSSSEGAL